MQAKTPNLYVQEKKNYWKDDVMKYQTVKGMDDLFPKEFAVREWLVNVLAGEARKFGFLQVSSPALESLKLLTAKSGDEVKDQIFVTEKKGSEELGLRFDLTVPMTRMFVAKQKELQKPVKWFAIAPMWRYEAPQKGRAREFMQLSVELFGSPNPEADATCINLIISCMEKVGLTSKDFTIKINNRKLLEGLLAEFVPEKSLVKVIQVIDKASKMSEGEFKEQLELLGVKKSQGVQKIIACKGSVDVVKEIKKFSLNALAKQGLEELENTLKLVNKKYITVDLSIARGLAYYTGNVFECFDREGKYRALGGGGRYDELVELFGGDTTPATGFAIGLVPLTVMVIEKGLLPKPKSGPEYYVAPVNEKVLEIGMEIVQKLRVQGKSADIDLMRRKLDKQFDYAIAVGARKIVIVGEKDLAQNQVTVRELGTGKEEKVSLNKI